MGRRIVIQELGSESAPRWSVDLYVDGDLSAGTYRCSRPGWHYDARIGEWCVDLTDPYGALWAEELYVGVVRQ